VPFEPGALRHIAKAASGSMRDSLSLLDQAIAHGAGKVEEQAVQDMLGTVGDDHLYAVLDALRANDVQALMGAVDGMEARSLSFESALQALASLLHRIALAQLAPAAIADEFEAARLAPYVEAFDAEFLQLAYQIAIHGRDELPWPRRGHRLLDDPAAPVRLPPDPAGRPRWRAGRWGRRRPGPAAAGRCAPPGCAGARCRASPGSGCWSGECRSGRQAPTQARTGGPAPCADGGAGA
jgi:DNA polymerase-3 subunit gamma/tau